MLNDACCFNKIYIATGYTDLRKGIDGLVSIIKNEFNLDPAEKNVVFLFCGKRTDRIKAIVWEGLSEAFCYPHILKLVFCNKRE